jgi:DNA-binding MarR family transcriptional regulator
MTISSSQNSSLLDLIYRAHQVSHEIFNATLEGADITPRQYTVLAAVARKDGASQTDITAMTGIDRSTLADVVRRLSRKGLISRRRTRQDARAYAVRLTPEGEGVVERMAPLVAEVDERLLSSLAIGRRAALREDLEAMIALAGRGEDQGMQSERD